MSLFYFDNFFQVPYAGHKIYCHGGPKLRFFKLVFYCKCLDTSMYGYIKCKNYKSQGEACEHALSSLIQTMNKKGLYPLPSDFSFMPKDC